MIESETDSVNAIGRELANGKEKGTAAGIVEDLIAATKVEDREITEVAAGTDCTEIGAETVIATEIDIETGEKMRKDLSLGKTKNISEMHIAYISLNSKFIDISYTRLH